jgi:hypothetical protein
VMVWEGLMLKMRSPCQAITCGMTREAFCFEDVNS